MNCVTSAIALMCTLFIGLASAAFHEFTNRHHDLDKKNFESSNGTLKNKLNEREASSYYTLHDPYQHRLDPYSRERPHTRDHNRWPKVYKTHGKGTAEIARGNAADIPNAVKRKNVSLNMTKDTDDAMVKYAAVKKNLMLKNGKAKGHRRVCKKLCPPNRTVMAMKGQNYVILSNPCIFNRWIHLSGPSPGSKIHEGTHTIAGILAPTNKYCQYQYQVIVKSCEELKVDDDGTKIECTNGNIWGSNCTVSCGENQKPDGPTELECTENNEWSNPIPKCKVTEKRGCAMPKIKSKSRIWCQTADLIHIKKRVLPEGASCRFYKNGKIIAITCKNGVWRGIRKIIQKP